MKNHHHNKRGKEHVEDKGLPLSETAESGSLSCIIQHPELANELPANAEHLFYHPKNKLIAHGILSLKEKGLPFDFIALADYFQSKDETFDGIGGPAALAEVFSYVDSANNFPHYLSILKDKLTLRSVITACNDTIDEAYGNVDDVGALLGRFYQRVTKCVSEGAEAKEKSIEEATDEWLDRYEKMMAGEIQTSMPTRWACMNKSAPIRPGYTIIMGPSKSGKSCLGFNLMTDGCLRGDRPGMILNYELSFQESMNRLIADYGNVHAGYLFEPDKCAPTREVMRSITTAISHIRKSKLQILSTRPSISEMCNKARGVHAKYGDLMVLIDYLQIAPDPKIERNEKTREQDVARNSGMARDLSKELGATVIALSQINKDGTARESAAPAQDCDLTLRVEEKGVRVLLQRNGPSGDLFPMHLRGEHFRFEEKTYSEIPG